jgi:hypothetical protein
MPPVVEPVSLAENHEMSPTADLQEKGNALEEAINPMDSSAWSFLEEETAAEGDKEPSALLDASDQPDLVQAVDYLESEAHIEALWGIKAGPQPEAESDNPEAGRSGQVETAMSLLARVSKEVGDMESLTEESEDAYPDAGDDALTELGDDALTELGDDALTEEEDLSEMPVAFKSSVVMESSGHQADSESDQSGAVNENNGFESHGEGDLLQISSFDPALDLKPTLAEGDAELVTATDPNDYFPVAISLDEQPAVLTSDGVSYFLVDEEGRPVLG